MILLVHGRIFNTQLFEIGSVFGRIIVKLLQLILILLHDAFIQVNGRGILFSDEGFVLHIFCLHVLEILFGFGDDRWVGEAIVTT